MASLSYYAGGYWMDFPYDSKPRKPTIKVLHATPNLVKFDLTDTDISVANALRRVIMAEVPTLAIEIVNIEDNDTVIFDEFLAHRMGLLPLSCHAVGDIPPDNGMVDYKDCTCFDGCPNCTREFRLDAVCEEDKVMTVTHFDMVDDDSSCKTFIPPDETPYNKVRIAPFRTPTLDEETDAKENGIILAKMKKNQRLKMVCHARKGISKYHAKWMPVATCLYQYEPILTLDRTLADSLNTDEKMQFVEACPRKCFGINDENKVQIERAIDCVFCDECTTMAKVFGKKDMCSVKMDTNIFHFTVEAVTPDGPRSVIDVVRAAMRIFDYKMSLFLQDAYGDRITEWLPREPRPRGSRATDVSESTT